MADKKISDFGTLTEVQSNDLLLVSSLNETYNIKAETFMDSVKNDVIDDVEDIVNTSSVKYNMSQSLTNAQKQTGRDNIAAASATDLDSLELRVEDLEYVPLELEELKITSPDGGVFLMGGSTRVIVSIKFNKVPKTITVNGNSVPPQKEQRWFADSVSSNTNFRVIASDQKSPSHGPTTVDKTVTLYFCNNIYCGAAAMPTNMNSSFVNGLSNKVLSNSKSRTININASSGQYLWYAVPKRLGTCTFKVGGFEGGFESPLTVRVTNGYLYEEDYYVYRSTNAGLGQTTVVVS